MCMQALKKLLAVVKHFEDFREDQFDFHSYCVRKMTLRSYVEMLRMEDTLHHNIFYSKVLNLPMKFLASDPFANAFPAGQQMPCIYVSSIFSQL